jgi:hypothetical protein
VCSLPAGRLFGEPFATLLEVLPVGTPATSSLCPPLTPLLPFLPVPPIPPFNPIPSLAPIYLIKKKNNVRIRNIFYRLVKSINQLVNRMLIKNAFWMPQNYIYFDYYIYFIYFAFGL